MENIEAIINLFRSTGYSHQPGAKVLLLHACNASAHLVQRPAKYPEEFFARADVPRGFVQMVIRCPPLLSICPHLCDDVILAVVCGLMTCTHA